MSEPTPRDYEAWNGERYPWPPPEGWFRATDGRWWAPRGGEEQATESTRVPPVAAPPRSDLSLEDAAELAPLAALPPNPRRWRQRIPLIGIAVFLLAIATFVTLAATGRLDGDPEPITATSLPPRAVDAPPVFREVPPPTTREVSTAAGTSLDPHAPADLVVLGDDTPASTAFEIAVDLGVLWQVAEAALAHDLAAGDCNSLRRSRSGRESN